MAQDARQDASGAGASDPGRPWALIGLLALAYMAGAWFGFQMAIPPGNVSPVWAPAGIALGAILLGGRRLWPGVWVGSFFANAVFLLVRNPGLSGATAVAFSLTVATGAAVQSLLGASLLWPVLGKPPAIRRTSDVFSLLLLGGVGSCLVNATIGTWGLYLIGLLPWSQVGYTWLTWWMGDALAVSLITPAILAWRPGADPQPLWRSPQQAVVVVVVWLLAMLVTYGPWSIPARSHMPVSYLLTVVFALAALTLSLRAATILLLLTAILATQATAVGLGPFVWGDLNTTLLMLGGFLCCSALVVLTLTVTVFSRRQQAIALEANQTLLQDVIEGVPVVVFVKDLQGRYLLINTAGARYLGKTVGEVLGHDDTQLFSPETVGNVMDSDRQVLETGRTIVLEEVGEAAGVRRTYLATKSPYLDADGRVIGVIGICRDITEAKRAAETRLQLEALQAADAMKNRFLSLVSHELRTPLTVIDGYGHLLRRGSFGPLNERQADAMTQILNASTRQRRLVNDLLDMGRILAGKFQIDRRPIQFAAVVRDSIASLRPEAALRRITLSWRDDSGWNGEIEGDAQRLSQVVCNLVMNALRYTPDDGMVRVCLSRRDTMLRCDVVDTGPGIPAEQVGQLFHPFAQLAGRKTGGAGLGLSICKEIVTAHGGTIGVDSTEGGGSTFWFTLPLPLAASAGAAPSSQAA